MLKIITQTPKETKQVAKMFAKEILALKDDRMKALVLALDGELGAGKTTFVQGFVAGLGIREEISSPTFLIMKNVKLHEHKLKKSPHLPSGRQFKNLFHLDCYRLKSGKELLDLDIKDIIQDRENIVLIEWAKNVKSIIPKDAIKIKFGYPREKQRSIEFEAGE